MAKINFKLFDLAIDKIKKPIAYYIDLQDNYFTTWIEAIYDRVPIIGDDVEDEELESVEDDYILETRTYPRDSIYGIHVDEYYKEGIQVYTVDLAIKDSPIVLTYNFQTKKEALSLYKKLIEYRYENKPVHNDVQ